MKTIIKHVTYLCAVSIVLSSCGTAKLGQHYYDKDQQVELEETPSRNLRLHYLGCGGLAIRHGKTLLMTDPFFSNTSLGAIALKTITGGNIGPREQDIRYGLNRVPVDMNMDDIKGVFISHAHYDHLLDVPWLYQHQWTGAQPGVYGSATAQFILKQFELPAERLINVEPLMADQGQAGQWINVAPGVRVLPIKSHHAHHFLGIKLYCGENTRKLRRKPGSFKSKLNHWKEGQTLAYLFELSDGEAVFNLFVQTSASKKPMGLPPADVLSGRSIDLAVLCVASYDNVEEYPYHHIDQLQPKGIIFVHWETFSGAIANPTLAPYPVRM